MRSLALLILLAVYPLIASSQQQSSQSRAQQVAAAFSKHKQVTREKRGVRMEKYKDVRSEPLVKLDVADYSGTYQFDMGDVIELHVASDGGIQATGHDANPNRPFTLQNARIDGAVLTATKVYRDGATERFEGVFLKRTEHNSPSDPGTTMVGLGVMLATPREFAGNTFDRLFYRLQD